MAVRISEKDLYSGNDCVFQEVMHRRIRSFSRPRELVVSIFVACNLQKFYAISGNLEYFGVQLYFDPSPFRKLTSLCQRISCGKSSCTDSSMLLFCEVEHGEPFRRRQSWHARWRKAII